MSEFQYIEEYADENSLVLGDELCNGTETDSAVAIFAAGLMFLNERKSSHIFATHLHAILDVKQIQEINTLDIKHLEVIYDDITKELIYVAVSITNSCSYCTRSHTFAAKKKGASDEMIKEMIDVVGIANQNNKLVEAYQVEVDKIYK